MMEFIVKGTSEAQVHEIVSNKIEVDSKVEINLREEGVYLVKVNTTLALICKNYLDNILKGLDFDYKMEVISSADNYSITFNIATDENAILIGKNGKGLQALRFLLQNYIRQFNQQGIIIKIDCGDYLAYRTKRLEILATRCAKDVLNTKTEIKLEPMNSYERRVVHSKLSEWNSIETISVGEEPNRCLVIKLKK